MEDFALVSFQFKTVSAKVSLPKPWKTGSNHPFLSTKSDTVLDRHLGGQLWIFLPKWVNQITKLGMPVQIESFWQNPRPPGPKMALFLHFYTWKGRYLGKAKLEETFLYILLNSNTWKEDFWSRKQAKALLVLTAQSRNTQHNIKYLCSLLYPNSSKEDFCKISLSSDEVVCMAAISTLKGGLLSIFECFC